MKVSGAGPGFPLRGRVQRNERCGTNHGGAVCNPDSGGSGHCCSLSGQAADWAMDSICSLGPVLNTDLHTAHLSGSCGSSAAHCCPTCTNYRPVTQLAGGLSLQVVQ